MSSINLNPFLRCFVVFFIFELNVDRFRDFYFIWGTHTTATHLTNSMFDGARADLAKVLSVNPIFQVTHSFTLASQTQEPTYSFGSVFIGENVGLYKFIIARQANKVYRASYMVTLTTKEISVVALPSNGHRHTPPKASCRSVTMTDYIFILSYTFYHPFSYRVLENEGSFNSSTSTPE